MNTQYLSRVPLLALAVLAGACSYPLADVPSTPPALVADAGMPATATAAPPSPRPTETPLSASPLPEAPAMPMATPTKTKEEPATAPTEPSASLAGLRNLGPAPELENEVWLNSPPLRLSDLRGRVVLIDMWTYG